MARKRRPEPADPLRELAWEEMAEEISPLGSGRLGCRGDGFADYLGRRFGLSGARSRGPSGRRFSRIYGWRVLEGRSAGAALAAIHRDLAPGGEAVLFGYCRFPGRDDLAAWEARCRERGVAAAGRILASGALALSRIAALLAGSPFEWYSIRKKGICYMVKLRR